MNKAVDIMDTLVAAHTLETALQKSSEDNVWRVVVCPKGPEGSLLKKVLSASVGGCGRSSASAKVSVSTPIDGVFQTPGDLVEIHRAGWARTGSFQSAALIKSWDDEKDY